MRSIWKFLWGEEAAIAVEYSVMLMLILMAVLLAVTAVGIKSANMWQGIDSKVADATQSG